MTLLLSRSAAPLAAVGLIAAACSAVGVIPPASPTPPMSIGISNGTMLTVTLVVNGAVIRTFGPGFGAGTIPASELPGLPWSVEARSQSGRVLVSMTVKAGDVSRTALPGGGVQYKGDGARVDLSCGRLDIWSGPPLLGPPPGSGSPGDCPP